MSDVVVTALIGACGSLIGALFGVIASNKLTQYRIQKLEEKVDKHNNLIERTYILEGQVSELQHDVRDLKEAS